MLNEKQINGLPIAKDETFMLGEMKTLRNDDPHPAAAPYYHCVIVSLNGRRVQLKLTENDLKELSNRDLDEPLEESIWSEIFR